METENLIKPFYFNREALQKLASENHAAYVSAEPFEHVVLDDFLPEWVADRVLLEFPAPGQIEWTRFNAPTENKKLSAASDERFGPFTRHLMAQFNSAGFLKYLQALTGVEGLIPDPYFLGGGLHQIERGGFLKVHTDFSWHTELKLERRLNLLVYLNRDWKEEYGGHLELWDKTMTRCHKRVLPVFNRSVLFTTSRFSYHGHPDPLKCPGGRTRRSLALYYYTATRPSDQDFGPHGTLFLKRPGEKWAYLKNFLARCVPPIFYDLVIGLQQKLSGKKRV